MTHPAAELLRAIADGKQMERELYGVWVKCTPIEALFLITSARDCEVRIARPMVTREVSYPEPLQVKPKKGYEYWHPNFYHGKATGYTWLDDETDNAVFNAGMAFATEADAAEAHKALFGAQT